MFAKLYVPTAVDDETEREVKRRLADEYGGYTAYGAAGGWLHDGEIIEEPVTVYEMVSDSLTDGGAVYGHFVELARYVHRNSDETEVLAYVGPSAESDGETISVRD